MPDYAMMEILVQVRGETELAKLSKQLQIVRDSTLRGTMATRVASKQMELEVAVLQRSNATLEARAGLKNKELRALAIEQREQRKYTAEFERRMVIEERALAIQHESRVIISDGNARIMAKEAIAKEAADAKFAEGERLKQIEINRTRKSLMAASISMFVLNISLGQLVQSIKPFVKGNEDLEKSVEDVSNALRFSMAPLQAYMALQMISKSIAIEQRAAYLGVASALGAIFFLYEAITSKSAGVRAAYAGIATALFAVAIASWMANVALATGKTLLLGDFKAFGVVAAGVAASAAIVAGLTAPKAQTLTDHTKRVRKGGIAILDDDEVVSRVSKDGTKSGDGGGDINIYLPDSYMGTLSDAKVTAETVRRYTQTGQGSIQFKRKVASNG